MRNPYSNDEVDSVAGQIYLFLSQLPTRTRLACIIIRFVSLFAPEPPHYDIIAKDYLETGAILLGHTFISRCHDTILRSGLVPLASRLHFVSFVQFARSNAPTSLHRTYGVVYN
jgi:hypothetical protein